MNTEVPEEEDGVGTGRKSELVAGVLSTEGRDRVGAGHCGSNPGAQAMGLLQEGGDEGRG